MTFADKSEIFIDPQRFMSTQWKLCSYNSETTSVYYEFAGETFSRVRFDFTIRRKSTFYSITLIFPCACLSVIQLLIFAIPCLDSSADRVAFGTINMLSMFFFLTMVTDEMPRTSDAITILSKYLIGLILLSTWGLAESVIVEQCRRFDHCLPPRFLLTVLRLMTFCFDETPFKKWTSGFDQFRRHLRMNSRAKELWGEFAYRLDLLTFWFSFAAIVAIPAWFFCPPLLLVDGSSERDLIGSSC